MVKPGSQWTMKPPPASSYNPVTVMAVADGWVMYRYEGGRPLVNTVEAFIRDYDQRAEDRKLQPKDQI